MKKRAGWVLLLLSLLYILGYVTTGFLFDGAFYISLLTVVFCFIWSRCTKKMKFKIYLDREQSQVGSDVQLIIEAENPSLLPVMWGQCWLRMPEGFGIPDNQACYLFSAGAHGSTRIVDALTCLSRGRFKWEKAVLKTGDPFGLFIQTIETSFEHILDVHPRVLNLNFSAQLLEHDQYNLRQYVYGDSMSSINWKTSARMQSLFVRERVRKAKPVILIALDCYQKRHCGSGPENSFETGVTLAASLAVSAMKKGYDVKLVTNPLEASFEGRDKCYYRGGFGVILQTLTRIEMTKEDATEYESKRQTGFSEIYKAVKDPACLYIITGVLDHETMELLGNYQKRGCRCTVFFLRLETFASGKQEEENPLNKLERNNDSYRTNLSKAAGKSSIKIIQVEKNTELDSLMRGAVHEAG